MGNWSTEPEQRAAPSWANDPPPATVPVLPPIRSATGAVTVTNPRLPAVTVPASSVAARPTPRPSAAGSTPPGDRVPRSSAFAAPFIIPGDGVAGAPPIRSGFAANSRLAHLAIFALALCLSLSALYLTAPLTVGAMGRQGAFGGGANGVDLPTATPTPTVAPAPVVATSGGGTAPNLGANAIIAQIRAVFGPYADGAIAIARCESGFNPNAWNPTPVLGSHAAGVFQILYPITWESTSQAGQSPYNANANILAAHDLFARDGNSWREWACQP